MIPLLVFLVVCGVIIGLAKILAYYSPLTQYERELRQDTLKKKSETFGRDTNLLNETITNWYSPYTKVTIPNYQSIPPQTMTASTNSKYQWTASQEASLQSYKRGLKLLTAIS